MFLHHVRQDHIDTVARAVVAACRGNGWAVPLQPRLLHVLFNRLLDRDIDFEVIGPATRAEVAVALQSHEERTELIQLMCAVEILCNPVSVAVEASVAGWARALGVDEPSLVYLRDLASGQIEKSLQDFYRLNWIGELDRRNPAFEGMLMRRGAPAYATTVEENEEVSSRWFGLGSCPQESIGRALFEFYTARGFSFPGQVGAANEAVAHHDWIHVLSDYATSPMGEIEVISFQTTCSRAPGATLGLIGALALFESGVMEASLITGAYPGEGLSTPGGLDRLAEAIQRGKACNTDLILDVDFFALADEPLEALRTRFGVPPKSALVRALDPYGARVLPPGK